MGTTHEGRKDPTRLDRAPVDGFPPLSEALHEIAAILSVLLAVAAVASVALVVWGAG